MSKEKKNSPLDPGGHPNLHFHEQELEFRNRVYVESFYSRTHSRGLGSERIGSTVLDTRLVRREPWKLLFFDLMAFCSKQLTLHPERGDPLPSSSFIVIGSDSGFVTGGLFREKRIDSVPGRL